MRVGAAGRERRADSELPRQGEPPPRPQRREHGCQGPVWGRALRPPPGGPRVVGCELNNTVAGVPTRRGYRVGQPAGVVRAGVAGGSRRFPTPSNHKKRQTLAVKLHVPTLMEDRIRPECPPPVRSLRPLPHRTTTTTRRTTRRLLTHTPPPPNPTPYSITLLHGGQGFPIWMRLAC